MCSEISIYLSIYFMKSVRKMLKFYKQKFYSEKNFVYLTNNTFLINFDPRMSKNNLKCLLFGRSVETNDEWFPKVPCRRTPLS